MIQNQGKNIFWASFSIQKDISKYHQKKLKRLEKDNTEIIFIVVENYLAKWSIPTIGHLSEETAYRLIIDKVFIEYHKVLYIDSDTIIRKDVKELYDTELEGCILGASRGRLVKGLYDYIVNELSISAENYINAGVLVINIDEFRREQIGEKGLKMLAEGEYLCQDQDVLNILCEDRIKYIDGRWNVEWQHLTGLGGEVIIDDARAGTLDYVQDPYIIHYTSRIKPWMRPDIELADYFWEEARKSPFYEEILFKNLRKEKDIAEYAFPISEVSIGSKCILYGYGRVGKSFYDEILREEYCDLIAICDKKADDIKELSIPVIVPDDIVKYDFDYVIIAVERSKLAEEIKKDLINIGVDEEKIKWKSPVTIRRTK